MCPASRPDWDDYIFPVPAIFTLPAGVPPADARPLGAMPIRPDRSVVSTKATFGQDPVVEIQIAHDDVFHVVAPSFLSLVRAKRVGPKRPSCGRGLLKGNTIISPRRCLELFAGAVLRLVELVAEPFGRMTPPRGLCLRICERHDPYGTWTGCAVQRMLPWVEISRPAIRSYGVPPPKIPSTSPPEKDPEYFHFLRQKIERTI
jgi:hypothetical protein